MEGDGSPRWPPVMQIATNKPSLGKGSRALTSRRAAGGGRAERSGAGGQHAVSQCGGAGDLAANQIQSGAA